MQTYIYILSQIILAHNNSVAKYVYSNILFINNHYIFNNYEIQHF